MTDEETENLDDISDSHSIPQLDLGPLTDEDMKPTPVIARLHIPAYVLDVGGCPADVLDLFPSGFAIAYHKRSDGSTAWKQHEPHAYSNGVIGSYELSKNTIVPILEVFPQRQDEWTTALPEDALEKDGRILNMLRNDSRGMLLVYKGQDGSVEFDLREGKHDDPQGYLVFAAEDRQLKPLSDLREFYWVYTPPMMPVRPKEASRLDHWLFQMDDSSGRQGLMRFIMMHFSFSTLTTRQSVL